MYDTDMLHMFHIKKFSLKNCSQKFLCRSKKKEGKKEVFRAQWDIELIEHLIMNDMCDDDWKNGNDLRCV